MNRPRPSILQLFDPLSSRDTNSPESDKENTVPDSEFFPQTFVKHPSPVRLTRRLIEVGDATVLEATGEEGSVCGEEMKEDEEDTVGPHPLSSPRTPLGDVTFDRERTPMRSKMYRRKANPTTTAILDGAPDDYAFASVIDAVNASGATFDASTVAPSVVISSAEDSPSSSVGDTDTLSTSVATLSLATPTGSLIADTIMTFPTPSEPSTSLLVPVAQPPHQATSIASFDMDRSSTDLQSSFALHMNMDSADSSFDLLNDRISFLGHGDEESFDIGAVGNATSEEGSKDHDTSATFPDRSHVNRGQDLIFTSVDNPGQKPVKHSPKGRQSRSESPLFQLSSALLEIPDTAQHPDTPSVTPFQPPDMPSLAPVFVAPVKHAPPIPVLSTSLPEPPSLVPALKIMKRKRPDTTTVSKTSAAAAAPSPIPDSASLSEPPTLINSGPARIASVPSTGRYVTEGPGPWRVPLSTSDKERVSATARIHKPTPGTTLLGPRRIPLPSQAPVPAPDPAPAVALPKAQVVQASGGPGLKGALRAVPPNGSASRVPRAAGGNGSRLPMPKSKIAGLTSGMSGLPRRKVA